jgi:hypothetical protein
VSSPARRNSWVGASILLNLGLAGFLFLILDRGEDSPRIPPPTLIEAQEQSVSLPPPPAPKFPRLKSPPSAPPALPPSTAAQPNLTPAKAVLRESGVRQKTVAARVPVNPPIKEGRVLLRQLEAGDGPAIEIAWPASQHERDALYRVFARCYGMTTAILGDDGRVYRVKDPPGAPWRLNPDRYSGFLRQASGRVAPAERRELETIRARHGIGGGIPVRLFPRAVDAALLGGLQRLTGVRFESNAVIRARYRLSGGVVHVANVQSAGEKAPGEFDLRPVCTD